MTRAEFAVFVAEMRKRWPNAREWKAETLEVFYRDLEPYGWEDVLEAFLTYYRKGRATPPNSGQLLALLTSSAAAKEPPKVSDPCICADYAGAFLSCTAGHDDPANPGAKGAWMRNREMELEAHAIVERAEQMGIPVDAGSYPGIDPTQIAAAVLREVYDKQERDHQNKPPGKIESGYLANIGAGMSPREALITSTRSQGAHNPAGAAYTSGPDD